MSITDSAHLVAPDAVDISGLYVLTSYLAHTASLHTGSGRMSFSCLWKLRVYQRFEQDYNISVTSFGRYVPRPSPILMSSVAKLTTMRQASANDFLATPYDACKVFQSRSRELV